MKGEPERVTPTALENELQQEEKLKEKVDVKKLQR